MVAYKNKFEIVSALTPESPVLTVDCDLTNHKRIPPKVAFDDRMLILKNKEGQLVFYDICRQKFVAQCEINNISSYGIVDDCLIIGVEKQQKILNTMVQSIEEEKVQIEYKKITLPFC